MTMKVTCTGCGQDCSNSYGTWRGDPYHILCIPTPAPKRAAKMRHCFNCGAELGCYNDYDPLDTCGKAACEREANNAREAERFEAHELLDRDMGW